MARPTISLCMICKDEAATLPGCLRSVADLVDEVVVVDTGSSDDTVACARQLGARVQAFPWCDSFAAARNESIAQARGDWILWLDGDEYLDATNRQRLRNLRSQLPAAPAAFFLRQRSPQADGGALLVDQLRLFPRLPELRWRYRVHEQILPAVARLGLRVHRTNAVIDHQGFADPATCQRKQQRNLRLLELDQRDHPDDPYVLFNLGWTYHELGRDTEAWPHLTASLAAVRPTAPFGPKLAAIAAATAQRLGQPADALHVAQQALQHWPDHPEVLHQAAALYLANGDVAAARASLGRLLTLPPEHVLALGADPAALQRRAQALWTALPSP